MKFLNIIYNQFRKDSLYRNSIYLMASTAVLAGSGFIFWLFVARLFTPESVGIATTLISVSNLISSISMLGLNISIIRYLSKSKEKNNILNSSFTVGIISSLIITAIFILGINIFSPELSFIKQNLFYISTFVIFMVSLTLNTLIEGTFIAYRAAGNVLFKNTIASVLKLLFIFVFVFFGAYGVFASFSLAVLCSVIVSIIVLIFRYSYRPKLLLKTDLLKKMAKFSLGNYISGFLYQIPSLILPLLVLNHLHAKTAAYYYIDTMILNLLIIIPAATSQTFFSEGSHDESLLNGHLIKSMKITALILVPAVLIVFFLGHFVLSFFGHAYEAEAFQFLQIISVSSIFMSVIIFGNVILRIKHKIKTLIGLSLIGSFITIIMTYFSVGSLVELGIGWTVSQALAALIYLIFLFKAHKISPRHILMLV